MTEQLAPTSQGGADAGGRAVAVKSAASTPLTSAEVMVSGSTPVFFSSIVWVGEVVPIGTTPRSPLAGSASSGPCSLPTTLNTSVLPT